MTGQTAAQRTGTRLRASVAASRKGFKAEVDDLRGRMCRLGLKHDAIAAEIGRRYRLRPRESHRLAWGWSLNHAAARFNALSAQQGTDPLARAGMTGPHLCEHEHWPDGGRKPSAFTLLMLAQLYQTDVLRLLDLADHENLAPQDRLTLIHRPQSPAARPSDEKLATLTSACATSPQGVAPRVPRSLAQLSNDVLDRKDAPKHLTGLLARVLDVAGELAAMIEICDPAAKVTPVVAENDSADLIGGQLALVQDLPG
jgi:hypothetical protein